MLDSRVLSYQAANAVERMVGKAHTSVNIRIQKAKAATKAVYIKNPMGAH